MSDKKWNIYHITANKTEKIAEVSNDSKFGLKLFGQIRSSEMSSTLFGKKKYGPLHFYIYRTDQNYIYVKTIENDCEYYFRYSLDCNNQRKKKIFESNDLRSAPFDGWEQIRTMTMEKKNKSEGVLVPQKKSTFGREMISLSVRQATFERIDDGRKKSVSRAMVDDTMARNFFVFNETFQLNKKITAYTPSFTKVIEDTCPFVPIDYKFVEIKAEGIKRTIVKRISNISVKKSYDVNNKYNWVITYVFE